MDCGANASCLDLGGPSACLPRDATCGDTAECPEGTECEAERCRNLCETTADCPGGQECDRGYCFSAESGTGGSGGGGGGSSGKGGSGGSASPEGGMSGDPGTGGVAGGTGGSAGKGGNGGKSGNGGSGGSAGTTTEPFCGDGTRDTGEACDDGNDEAADGCTDCARDTGFSCSGNAPTVCAPICGDGLVVGAEALAGGCDDNGQEPNDGCSATCTVEDGWSCSDMPSKCTEGCGDGVVDPGEGCDDGDTMTGDGCAACAVELGFTCDNVAGQKSRCTDIDECTDGDFDCDPNADCENRPGGYDCNCRDGWDGPGDTCTDINECENDTCAFNAICMNSEGSFTCECPLAFAGDGIVCQDAQIPDWPVPAAPDYTVNAGVVHDNVTGLDWQQETDGPYARAGAVTHCQGLVLGGFSDWRLPTRVEIATLFFERSNGGTHYIDETTFPDTEATYWTSSIAKGLESTSGWTFSFSSISSDQEPLATTLYVRCVRSTPNGLAPQRFTVLTNNSAVDNETGLVWATSTGTAQGYSAAGNSCDGFVFGDDSDFRLPTMPELLTILDYEKTTAMFYADFGDPGSDRNYWTTTNYDVNRVGIVDFGDGEVQTALTSVTSVRRRCVQSP